MLAVALAVLCAAGTEAHAESIPPLLQQAKPGIPANDVECTDDWFRMQSTSGVPACIFAESILALEGSGFVMPYGMTSNVFPVSGGMPSTNTVLTSSNCYTQCGATLNSKLDTPSPLTMESDRFVDHNVNGDEGLYVQHSTNGTAWTTLASYTEDNNQDTDEWAVTPLTLDINQSSTGLRFIAKSSTPHEFIEIDNLSTYPKVANTAAQHETPTPLGASDGSGDSGNPSVYGDRPFVTTWKTTTANETVSIPLEGSDITIRWGDGHASEGSTGVFSHAYASPDNHTVSISGGMTRIHLGNEDATADKLVSINQWGDVSWTSMVHAFNGAQHMVYAATDSPDLSGVTDMSRMFVHAESFNGDISAWDVSSVTGMSGVFQGARSFNGDISAWDVSSVTDMYGMFSNAESFNGDISAWDVSSVTSMSSMFHGAESFNGDISAWDVSSVTNMGWMFQDARSFNGDISAWDVSSVTDMYDMFANAESFNGDISAWDVSSVTNMSSMFWHARSFNGDISAWDVSSVIGMSSMFGGASRFDSDISAWDVSSVINMGLMFRGASSFDGDISAWDVSSVTDMGGMFQDAYSFNGDISAWDVSSVTSMGWMFQDASSFDGDISDWDTSAVTYMFRMFRGADSFNGDISDWDTSAVTGMSEMFRGASSFDGDISDWDTSGRDRHVRDVPGPPVV